VNDIELLAEDLPERDFAIKDLVPIGSASLLVGREKSGKSLLALQWAIAVAQGLPASNTWDTSPGHVLFIGLEDDDIRLQKRVRLLLKEMKLQPNGKLHLESASSWPDDANGGLDMINQWSLDFSPYSRLVVIDTFGQFKPTEHSYSKAISALKRINAIADSSQIAILLVHHLYRGKRLRDDPLWRKQVQGSIGLTASASSIIGLDHVDDDPDALLLFAGKDIPSGRTELTYDKQSLLFSSSQTSDKLPESKTQRLIAFITANPGSKATDIPISMGNYGANRQALWQANASGLLERHEGRYYTPQQWESIITEKTLQPEFLKPTSGFQAVNLP
jgi:hypothetical protein